MMHLIQGPTIPVLVSELPSVVILIFVAHDLLKGGYVASYLFNERQRQFQAVARHPEDYFSPAALVAEGIR